MNHSFENGWLEAAHYLERPYPVEIFPKLTDEEVRSIVKTMNDFFPYASERMHAQWARHWAKMLREQVE